MATVTAPEVRERIIQLAREIEQLSKRPDVPPEDFFTEFLRLLVSALGASAGVVWQLSGAHRLEVTTEIRLGETELREDPAASRRNGELLGEVLENGQSRVVPPSDDGSEFPSRHLLVLAPLQNGRKTVGVVEIFQRPDAPPPARAGYLQFAEQMCGLASRWLERRHTASSAIKPAEGQEVEQFSDYVLQMRRTLDLSETASVAANDGRLYLGCDRLSVAVRRGKKIVIQAISGQDTVNRRANLVRAMRSLATKVVAAREPLTFTGRADDLPPSLEQPLATFVEESGARMVMVIPLFAPEPLSAGKKDEEEERQKRKRAPRPIGCLIVEQMNDSQPQPGLQQRVDLVSEQVAAALNHALYFRQVFLLPVWRTMGRSLEWFHGRKLWKTLAVLTLIAGIVAALALVPWEYRVEGEGRLMPIVQHQVFAPLDGEVEELFVEGGQRVEKGQELVRLRNDDLTTQLVSLKAELDAKQETKRDLERRVAVSRRMAANDQESLELGGQLEQTKVEIGGLQKQIEVLEERRNKLIVRAPITGVVATFQVEQMLGHRPVRAGEILLEVMDDQGPWHLELEVPENRLGHVMRAQKRLETEQLGVEYILASNPEKTFTGHLKTMATRAAQSQEHGNVVEAFVALNEEQTPPHPRIGAEVTAKIGCGDRALGYVLFGDVIEFVQRYLWL